MAAKNTSEANTGQTDRCDDMFCVDEQRIARARAAMPSRSITDVIAASFKAISHPTRVRILRALSGGELCVCELSETVGLSVSATSHQLSHLKGQQLVQSRAQGKLVHYSLGDHFVVALLDDYTSHLTKKEAV